jgi:uncharacterized protein
VTAVVERDQSSRRERLEDLLVVDCDVHVHESAAALAPYCDPPWRTSLETVSDVQERYLDVPGLSASGIGKTGPAFPTGNAGVRVVETPDAMRAELSAIGVDIGILFPDHLLKLPLVSPPEYAAALARAYNAWLVDRWCAPGTGLLGCLVACPQDPEDTAREIERYSGHRGVVGVYLPCAAVEPLWGNRSYDPIFRAAQDAGFPVLLHSVTVIYPVFPANIHGFETGFAIHSVGHTFAIMANLISLIETAVPVRFPELKVAVTEAGISWVPFLCNRLDKEYLERRSEVPLLKERPSAYLKRFYYATQPIEEPEDLADVVKLVDLYDGADTTVFASDWPHHDFDHPMKLAQMPFPPETRRKILGENALRLFSINERGERLRR